MKALVTVSSKDYLEGTKVLFQSFLEYNQWFDGELVVIHDDLGIKCQNQLKRLFPVRFVPVDEALKTRTTQLTRELPQLKNRYRRFWSLSAFSLRQYEKVIFMDSDMLCTGSVLEAFDFTKTFSACPDAGSLYGVGRDGVSFEKKAECHENDFMKTFNAGFMIFSPIGLKESVFYELLDQIQANTFRQVSTGHTDQYLLNVYFKNQVEWLGQAYNFLLGKMDSDSLKEEIKVLHFIRHPKPWRWKALLKLRVKNETPSHYKCWHESYRNIMLGQIRSGNIGSGFRHLLSRILVG